MRCSPLSRALEIGGKLATSKKINSKHGKLLEVIGLVLVLISWGAGVWGVEKYSSEISDMNTNYQVKSQYYQSIINGLTVKLEIEIAKKSLPQDDSTFYRKSFEERMALQEKYGTAVFLLYEINDLNEFAWESWMVRKKWLDVFIAKLDYIEFLHADLDKVRLQNNINPSSRLSKPLELKEKYYELINDNYIDKKKTVEFGYPYLESEQFSHYQAMAIDRNLTISGIVDGLMKARKSIEEELNKKKQTGIYVLLFVMGSLLIVLSKLVDYFLEPKE